MTMTSPTAIKRKRVRNTEREKQRRKEQQRARTQAARKYRALYEEITEHRLGFIPKGCEWTALGPGGKLIKHLCPALQVCKIIQSEPECPLPCELSDDLVDIPVRQVRDGWIDELHEPLRTSPLNWRGIFEADAEPAA